MSSRNESDRRTYRNLGLRMTRRTTASGADVSDNEPKNDASSVKESTDTTFECNVCFDTPKDPVVTPCGHLYCWSCLYRWIRLHADSPQCPVCKAGVDKRSVIPIYGRGRLESEDPRQLPLPDDEDVPPRPSGRRDAPSRQAIHPNAPYGVHHTFGINAHPGNYEFSFSNFGLFPSIFGLQVAYPHVNEPPHERREQQEENLPELGTFLLSLNIVSEMFFAYVCFNFFVLTICFPTSDIISNLMMVI